MKRLVLIAAFIIFPQLAWAEAQVVDAGTADLYEISRTSDENVKNIYTRQLEYRQQRLEYRRDIAARQKSFARPRRQAWNNYEANLKSVNTSRTDWQGKR